MSGKVQTIPTVQGYAYVIDLALDEDALQWIDYFRRSLPLDSKRPTVDRRFFADGLPVQDESKSNNNMLFSGNHRSLLVDRPMSHLLEVTIRRVLRSVDAPVSDKDLSPKVECHVFRYQRFLEYTKVGSELGPHTDGTKVCEDTQQKSTHTLLLYLSDCENGGETVLLKECVKEFPPTAATSMAPLTATMKDNPVIISVKPRRGRILLFPHTTPHAGRTVVSTPKICLRAEVALHWT